MNTKIKNVYSVMIAVILCLVFKLFANLSEDNIKDFFNILAVSIPGSIVTLTILKNKEVKERKYEDWEIERMIKLWNGRNLWWLFSGRSNNMAVAWGDLHNPLP